MWKDPIVEEVRAFRTAHAAKFKHDVKAIVADARRRQQEGKRPLAKPCARKRKAS